MTEPRDRRLRKTLLLLRSRDLYDAPTLTSTGQMIRTNTQAEAGEGNEEWRDCPACGGRGRWVRRSGREEVCARCKGRALILVDQYTGREIGSEKTEARSAAPLRMVPCDACIGLDPKRERGDGVVAGKLCERCSGSGWAPAFRAPIRPFRTGSDAGMVRDLVRGLNDPKLRAIVVKGALGSYNELSLAMAQLRVADLRAYRAAVRLETDRRSLREIRYDLAAWFALHFLEMRMPEPIRVPPDVVAIERREGYERRRKAA